MKQEKVKDYYKKGGVVSKYEKKRFSSSGGSFVDRNEKDIVLSMFKEENVKTVLDVGCGTGRFSILLAQNGYSLTSLDQSEEMLEVINKKCNDQKLKIHTLKGDAFSLPFEDNTFDACVSMRVLWHFKDPEGILKEMIRVTKKDGIIVFDLLNKKSLRLLYTPIANLFVYTNLMRIKKMRELIEKSNVKIIKEKEFFIIPYFLYRYSLSFIAKILGGLENRLQKTKTKSFSSVIYFKLRK